MYKLILGSKSPRRQELIRALGLPVEIRVQDLEENYPPNLAAAEVPEYLAKQKAKKLTDTLREDEILVCSDTVVILENKILGKPKSEEQAIEFLERLSGKTHTVISGVFLATTKKMHSFSCETSVEFYPLEKQTILHYVQSGAPLDKAGAYGIQDWIGQIGVKSIHGSYYNVMGLPLAELKLHLNEFFQAQI